MGIEPGTFRQPVLKAEPLGRWWGFYATDTEIIYHENREKRSIVAKPGGRSAIQSTSFFILNILRV